MTESSNTFTDLISSSPDWIQNVVSYADRIESSLEYPLFVASFIVIPLIVARIVGPIPRNTPESNFRNHLFAMELLALAIMSASAMSIFMTVGPTLIPDLIVYDLIQVLRAFATAYGLMDLFICLPNSHLVGWLTIWTNLLMLFCLNLSREDQFGVELVPLFLFLEFNANFYFTQHNRLRGRTTNIRFVQLLNMVSKCFWVLLLMRLSVALMMLTKDSTLLPRFKLLCAWLVLFWLKSRSPLAHPETLVI